MCGCAAFLARSDANKLIANLMDDEMEDHAAVVAQYQETRRWGHHDRAALPPNEEQPANLPLRLSLARAILAVLRDEAGPNAWLGVTSLIHRDDLARVLPTTHAEAAQRLGGVWRLAEGNSALTDPPRTALCRLLGLASK